MLLVPEQTVAAPEMVPDTEVGLTTAAIVATFWVVEPETKVIFPDAPFVAEADKRTYIVVEAIAPADWVKVILLVKPVPEVKEIS